jgi:hypothetical protein
VLPKVIQEGTLLPENKAIYRQCPVKSIQFDPISVNFSEVTLVHHKYRTLALPHEGCVVFPLGKPLEMTEKEFCQMLNLVS